MMTTVRMLLLAALLIPARLACASGWVEERGDGTTVIHVSVFDLPDPGRVDTFSRAEAAGVKEFTRQFPAIFARQYRDRYRADPETYGRHNWDKVAVELHRFSGISIESMENDLLAIAGGAAPDVVYVNFRRSDNYVRSGFLHPLDSYLAALSEQDLALRIHPKIWPVIRRKGPDGQTRVWALPYGGALGIAMLYRKDLFDRHHIPYPDINWTWEDLEAAARKMTDPAGGTWGMLGSRGRHQSWYWLTFLWSAGAEVMVRDEQTDQWHCAFDSREAAVALEFITRLQNEKWTDRQGKIQRGYVSREGERWARGEIGFMFDYVDGKVFSTINPEVVGMAPVPRGYARTPGDDSSRVRGAELNSRMMGLFSQIKHPAVRDAAWEYIRWYDCPEALRIKTRVMVEGGLGRFINPRYLREFGYPEIERFSPPGWAETFATAIETGKPEPYGKNSNLSYPLLTEAIIEAENLCLDDALPRDYGQRVAVMQGILKRTNARANEVMIGIVSPGERRARDAVAWVVLAAIVFAFGLGFRRTTRIFAAPDLPAAARGTGTHRRYFWAYILLLPAAVTIFVWSYVPLLRGSVMALQDYEIILPSRWVWVRNFGDLLWDRFWWRALYDALRYSFLILALGFVPPILLAILLQEVPRGKLLFRLIYYLPALMSGLVVITLWKQFFDASERGAMNAILLRIPAAGFVAAGIGLLLVAAGFARRLWYHGKRLPAFLFLAAGALLLVTCAGPARGILFPPGQPPWEFWRHLLQTRPEGFRWLDDPAVAMFACILPMVWAQVGPGCLIYLAALKSIPDDLYEAADIDGTTFIDKILFVVFPILRPLIVINFVGAFIGSMYGASENILVMTGGGGNTEVAGLYIFFKAFLFLKMGSATAAAWMLALMLIGFTVYQLRILSRVEFRTTGGDKG